jgi:hypothetical protein
MYAFAARAPVCARTGGASTSATAHASTAAENAMRHGSRDLPPFASRTPPGYVGRIATGTGSVMQILDTEFWNNSVQTWLTALGVGLLVTLGLRLIVAIAVRRLRKISEHTKNDIDDIVVDVIANTKPYFLILVGIWVATRFLELPENFLNVLRWILAIVVVFQVAAWANVAITAIIQRRIKATREEDPAEATTMAALGFLIRLVVWRHRPRVHR